MRYIFAITILLTGCQPCVEQAERAAQLSALLSGKAEAIEAKQQETIDELKANTAALQQLKQLVSEQRKEAIQSEPEATPVETPTIPQSRPLCVESPGVRLQFWGASWCAFCPAGKSEALKAAEQLGVTLEVFDYDKHVEQRRQARFSGGVPQTHIVIDGLIKERLSGVTSAKTIVVRANELAKRAGEAAGEASHQSADNEQLVGQGVSRRIDNGTGSVSMQWNFAGNWNPTAEEMRDHLYSHNVDASSMTRQQMASLHDSIHNGTYRQPVRYSQPVRRQSGGRFFGIFRQSSSCPGGVCP